MDTLKLKACAKINLCLHIPFIHDNGYHELDSVFQSIGLFDVVTLQKVPEIAVVCDAPDIPSGPENIAYRAARAMVQEAGTEGVRIIIEKRIFSQAGLGGGSADAAAVIFGMNRLYQIGLNEQTMMRIGAKIGADVPFFIRGGCMRARGIGDILTPLCNPFDHDLIILKPKSGIKTPECYRRFDALGGMGGSADAMIAAMERKDEKGYLEAVHNALQPAAAELVPKIQNALDALVLAGAKAAAVTGSGSAVFGLFEKGTAAAAEKKLKAEGFEQAVKTEMTDAGLLEV